MHRFILDKFQGAVEFESREHLHALFTGNGRYFVSFDPLGRVQQLLDRRNRTLLSVDWMIRSGNAEFDACHGEYRNGEGDLTANGHEEHSFDRMISLERWVMECLLQLPGVPFPHHSPRRANANSFRAEVLDRSRGRLVAAIFADVRDIAGYRVVDAFRTLEARFSDLMTAVLIPNDDDLSRKIREDYFVYDPVEIRFFSRGAEINGFAGSPTTGMIEALLTRLLPDRSVRVLADVSASSDPLREFARRDEENRESDIFNYEYARAAVDHGEYELAWELLARIDRYRSPQSSDARALRDQIRYFVRDFADDNLLDSEFADAMSHVRAGRFEAGFEGLLAVIRREKNYRDGLARDAIVATFERCPDPDLVAQYRRHFSRELF